MRSRASDNEGIKTTFHCTTAQQQEFEYFKHEHYRTSTSTAFANEIYICCLATLNQIELVSALAMFCQCRAVVGRETQKFMAARLNSIAVTVGLPFRSLHSFLALRARFCRKNTCSNFTKQSDWNLTDPDLLHPRTHSTRFLSPI